MKKIFTLLICVVAMSFAAHANDNNMDLVYRCIDVLMGKSQPTAIMTTNLDANHDGVIDIADVTTLIDMALLAGKPAAKAPALETSVEDMIDNMLDGVEPTPTIGDVTDAIDKKLEK